MKKIIIFLTIILFIPLLASAQSENSVQDVLQEEVPINETTSEPIKNPKLDEVFEARVIKIIEEKEITREDGSRAKQQNLLLRGSSGNWKNKEITYEGISDFDIVSTITYKVGDKVLVQNSPTEEGDKFFIVDYVRRGYIYFLAILFIVIIAIVGGFKGLRALVGLAISFFILVKIILPLIMSGYNPLLVGLFGALSILAIIILLTEGWNRKSRLAIISVLFSLLVVLILSVIFTGITRLTGLSQEESVFLMNLGAVALDFKGLLLAGIMIGAIGVLDDVIIGQIEAVERIQEANPSLTKRQTFQLAYKVGNTHLGAIVNTLFLTYAGAALPLLLLFTIKQPPFMTFGQVINNEIIATEIVRTLIGSIGIALSLPIATYLAAFWLKAEK